MKSIIEAVFTEAINKEVLLLRKELEETKRRDFERWKTNFNLMDKVHRYEDMLEAHGIAIPDEASTAR